MNIIKSTSIMAALVLHAPILQSHTINWYDKRLPMPHHTAQLIIDVSSAHSWDDLFNTMLGKARREKEVIFAQQPTSQANVCKHNLDFTIAKEQSKILIHPLCDTTGKKLFIVYGFQDQSLWPQTLLHDITQSPNDYQITFVTLKPKKLKQEKSEYAARQAGSRGKENIQAK